MNESETIQRFEAARIKAMARLYPILTLASKSLDPNKAIAGAAINATLVDLGVAGIAGCLQMTDEQARTLLRRVRGVIGESMRPDAEPVEAAG